jgi:hypothetical protein
VVPLFLRPPILRDEALDATKLAERTRNHAIR